MVRGLATFLGSLAVVALLSAPAFSQPKNLPALEGASEVMKLTTPTGFIDDAIAVDGDRIAYVVADSSAKAELHVLVLSTKAEQVVDIAPITLHPLSISLVAQRAFIVGEVDGKQVAAMVDLVDRGKQKPAGSVIYKIPPATHITLLGNKIAAHRVSTTATSTKHEVELLGVDNGKRISTRTLELATGDIDKKNDFRVNHWSEGWTKAHGIKGGDWDRKENQRSPDTEATYDMVSGKLLDRKKIDDLFEQRKRFQALADANGKIDFVRVGWDNTSLQAWRGGKLAKLELEQPLATYDVKNLIGVVTPDSVWVAAKVDPVNAEAVARKKADPEYLDIFVARSTASGGADGKAARKARILAHGIKHKFGVMGGDRFYLVERNQTMERGGKSLTIYKLN
jgi:hypothetical protein